MLLTPKLLYCLAIVIMVVQCRKSSNKSTSLKPPKENLSPKKTLRNKTTSTTEPSISLFDHERSSNKINSTKKPRQTRRKTTGLKSKTETGHLSGITTQRPKPHIRPHPTTPPPSTDYTLDEIFKSDSEFFEKLSKEGAIVNEREKRKEEVLKAFQQNSTGRFREWPFPFTESTYIHEFNTLNMDGIRIWKNATRDFTELRREYVKESRSLHVAEMFTSFRRQGTRFYTVLGIEGWDGNIFEYPDIPYKYKDNPGSSFSVKTEEVETRDPRVLRYTEGESRFDIKPRYRLGRQGEWIIDFTNEPYFPPGPHTFHWPFKWRESDPDNATVMLRDLPTFARRRRRKRRGLSTVRMRRRK